MKHESTARPYRMKARAEAAAKTAENILRAAVALWREHSLEEITLQDIANGAGVSVQTVIRRFGSKEGVFDACIEGDAAGVRVERDRASVGDVEAALDILMSHYERDGDAVLRTLALEDKLEAARGIVERGRREHRMWCSCVFGPYLPPPGAHDRDTRLDAFVAATDLYLWKLLRRDLGRTADESKIAIRSLVEGLVSLGRADP